MELWIRSQDKHILQKVKRLYVCRYSEEKEYGIYDMMYDALEDLDDTDVPLGFYKSKERALEVLNEIQKLIKPTIINTKYNCEIKDGHNKNEFDLVMQPDESKFEIIQPTTIVYEMPEK